MGHPEFSGTAILKRSDPDATRAYPNATGNIAILYLVAGV
jgi:hypothetical protein